MLSRDHDGKFIKARVCNKEGDVNPENAEAIEVRSVELDQKKENGIRLF